MLLLLLLVKEVLVLNPRGWLLVLFLVHWVVLVVVLLHWAVLVLPLLHWVVLVFLLLPYMAPAMVGFLLALNILGRQSRMVIRMEEPGGQGGTGWGMLLWGPHTLLQSRVLEGAVADMPDRTQQETLLLPPPLQQRLLLLQRRQRLRRLPWGVQQSLLRELQRRQQLEQQQRIPTWRPCLI